MNLIHSFFPVGPQAGWKLRKYSDEQLAEVSEHLKQEWTEQKKKKEFLLCRNCSHIITSLDFKVEIDGRYMHTFKNPAGVVYTIGCFSKAVGCFNLGEPTQEYTWFPGFAWSYANCFNCFTHLGWFYRSAQNSFYGLILDHLTTGTRTVNQ
ncbi:MAG TPA: cereblon family protein [Candidatus Deferrimicrobium sp.]|nr:cereblon family protein [Candidatus Deferrimicrobium sp.]